MATEKREIVLVMRSQKEKLRRWLLIVQDILSHTIVAVPGRRQDLVLWHLATIL